MSSTFREQAETGQYLSSCNDTRRKEIDEDGLSDDEPHLPQGLAGARHGRHGCPHQRVHRCCEGVSSKVLVFYSGLRGAVIALICSAFDPENKIIFNIWAVEGFTWLLVGLVGLMGIIGHFSLTRSWPGDGRGTGLALHHRVWSGDGQRVGLRSGADAEGWRDCGGD